jgi:hypothetical protein
MDWLHGQQCLLPLQLLGKHAKTGASFADARGACMTWWFELARTAAADACHMTDTVSQAHLRM